MAWKPRHKTGSSCGPQPTSDIVDCLERMGINILFVIGGDGTLRGPQIFMMKSHAGISKSPCDRNPKTIDNDLMFTDES